MKIKILTIFMSMNINNNINREKKKMQITIANWLKMKKIYHRINVKDLFAPFLITKAFSVLLYSIHL